MQKTKETLWHNIRIPKVLSILKTSREGLSEAEAARRKELYGKNILPEDGGTNAFEILFSQLSSPLVYVLLVASFISLLLKSYLDLLIILVVVFLNTGIGFVQEYKANQSMDQLKKMIAYKTTVMREGKEREIPIEDIVPGDIIILHEGARIPADSRIIESSNLEVVEATLTGESVASVKNSTTIEAGTVLADRENMAYMGTMVVSGAGVGAVTSTGGNSQLGLIASLIQGTRDEKTPLQHKLTDLTRNLTAIVIIIAFIVVFIGIFRGQPLFYSANGHEEGILYTGISLAVAAIPEGLLVAVTVILALGMKKILKQKSLVRRLIAAETLGSTSVICTDKTGTLTEGKMSVAKIFVSGKTIGFEEALGLENKKNIEQLVKISVLCNDAFIENFDKDISLWSPIGDPTETALIAHATQLGFNKDTLEREYPRMQEIPFHTELKLMATLNETPEKKRAIFVKGSPENVLSHSSFFLSEEKIFPLDKISLHNFKERYEQLTREGLRVLACAYKKADESPLDISHISELVFAGFIGIQDPVRKDAKKTFQLTRLSGIRTIIVTGDHKYTTQKVAREIGMEVKEENILEGKELDKMTDDELYRRVKNIEIYSRVNPHHKLRIIDAWQKRGEVVAMTGDGVNDGPALKSADIGIAMNSGNDVAKENADMILLDDNFKTIISAVEQGRIIFDNIRKVVLYLLSDSFAEITMIIASLVFGLPLPLLPVQILWINLIADGLPTLSFTLEEGEKNILLERPRKKSEPLINLEMRVLIFLISVGVTIPLFIVYYFLVTRGVSYDIDHIRTIIFSALALSTLIYSYSCRSLKRNITRRGIFNNPYLNAAVIIGFFLQILALYQPHLGRALRTVPLNFYDWWIILIFSFSSLSLIELVKVIFIGKSRKSFYKELK